MDARLAAKYALEAEVAGPLERASEDYIADWHRHGGIMPVRNRMLHQHAFEVLLIRHYARVVSVMLGEIPDDDGDLAAVAVNRRHAERLAARALQQAVLIIAGIDREIAKAGVAVDQEKAVSLAIETKESFGTFTIRLATKLVEQAKKAMAAVSKKIPAIANVQTQEPAEEAVYEWVEDHKADSTVINVWSTMLDERVRDWHQEAEGQERRVDQPFDVGGEQLRFPGDTSLGASLRNVINCFVGSTAVSGVASAATRHSYSGNIVEITTSGGKKLTGTPNHPILTGEGWIALGSLHKGSNVVCGSRGADVKTVSPGEPVRDEALHVDDVESTIEQVFDAFATGRVPVRVAGVAVDFHGDQPAQQVDVVGSDRLLHVGRHTAVAEKISKFCFASSDLDKRLLLPDGLAFLLNGAGLGPASGRIGAGCDALPLSEVRLAHAKVHGGAAAAGLNPAFNQSATNNCSGDPELVGKSLFRHPVQIELDEVVDVNVKPVVGVHVYNLETVHGLFLAEGIVSHNCRCSAVFYAVDADGNRRDLGIPTPRVPTRRYRRPNEPVTPQPSQLQPTKLVTLNGNTNARVVLGNGRTLATMRQTSPSTIEVLVNRRPIARATHKNGTITDLVVAPEYQSLGIGDLIKRSVEHSFQRTR